MSIVIRRAKIGDVDDILAIQRLVYAEEYVESKELFCDVVSLGESLIVEYNDWVIGFLTCHFCYKDTIHRLHNACSCTPVGSKWLYINDLSIDPKFQGFGVGTQVVGYVLDECTRLRVEGIQLLAVGQAAIFWKKMGFNIMQDVQCLIHQDRDLYRCYGDYIYFMGKDVIRPCRIQKTLNRIDDESCNNSGVENNVIEEADITLDVIGEDESSSIQRSETSVKIDKIQRQLSA